MTTSYPRVPAGRSRPALLALAVGLAASTAWADEPPPGALSVEDCVRRALEASPDLLAARSRIRAAEAGVGAAGSAYQPSVYLEEGYTVTNNPPLAFMSVLDQRRLSLMQDFNDPDATENFNTRVGVDWQLYAGGQRRQGVAAARAGADLRTAQERSTRNSLTFEVHRTFYSVLRAQELASIQEAAAESLQTSLDIARRRLEAGTVIKTDVLNLEVRLAEVLEQLARARNHEALARSTLATVVGDPAIRDAALDDRLPPFPSGEPPAEAVPDDHPDLLVARAQVEQRQAESRSARGARRPAVNLRASYDLDTESFSDVEDSWFAGVSARWDVFDGSRRAHAIVGADAELEASREAARRARLDAEHRLQEALLGYAEARERVEVTAKSIESADESLRVTRQRYENGTADITELLDSEASLVSARALAAAARYDREIALARLRWARGEFVQAPGPKEDTSDVR